MWPKSWSIEKIKRITQEASENIFERAGNKFRGTKKEVDELVEQLKKLIDENPHKNVECRMEKIFFMQIPL